MRELKVISYFKAQVKKGKIHFDQNLFGYDDKMAKFSLFVYLVSLITISFSYNLPVLVAIFFVLAAICGRDFVALITKAIKLTAIFSLTITLSYSAVMYVQGVSFVEYLTKVNLRALDMIFLTLIFVRNVNIYEALSFSRELTFLLVLSVSKIVTMQKAFADYKDALKSRTIIRPDRKTIYEYLGSSVASFLDKNIRDGKENFEAMKSRGFSV